MKKYLRYAWVLLVFAGGLLFWILFHNRTPPPDIKLELEAVNAREQAEKMEVELGRERTLQKLAEDHAEELKELEEEQGERIEELKKDPGKLALHLVRRRGRKRAS